MLHYPHAFNYNLKSLTFTEHQLLPIWIREKPASSSHGNCALISVQLFICTVGITNLSNGGRIASTRIKYVTAHNFTNDIYCLLDIKSSEVYQKLL